MKKHRTGTKLPSEKVDLSSNEWDFRRIPENEAMACCVYEYSRERVKQSSELQALLAAFAECERAKKGSRKRKELFTALFAFTDRLAPKGKMPYIHADLLTAPWLGLSQKRRNWLAAEGRELPAKRDGAGVRVSPLPRLERETLGSFYARITVPVENISPIINDLREHPSERSALESAFLTVLASVEDGATIMNEPREHLDFGLFAINWDYPIERLRDAFADWLNREYEKRAPSRPALSRRGKIKADSPRSWLIALGAKRLLDTGRTVNEARKYSMYKPLIEGGQPPLYSDDAEWSKAKNVIVPKSLARFFGD
jgi:hypothetical protein